MHLCSLHIGLPKSGSTTIQSMIFANRVRLLKHGIYVPEASTNGYARADHHLLAWDFLGRRSRQGVEGNMEALRVELARRAPKHVLITSEYFQEKLTSPRYVASLRDVFAGMGYRLRIIAYVRPQPDYINSNYAQNVKLLNNSSAVNAYVGSALKLGRFDYARWLLPATKFDDIDTIYRPFNREVLARGISQDFLATLGFSQRAIAGMKFPQMENVTPGPMTMALCLAFSRRLAKHGITLDDDARNRASRVLQDMGDHMGWNATKFAGISGKNALRLRRRFAAGNDVFSLAVWNKRWDEVFGEDCWTPPPYNAFHGSQPGLAERRELRQAVASAWRLLNLDSAERQPPAAEVQRRRKAS